MIDKEAYIRSGGVKCPYCGSENIEADVINVDGKEGWSDVYCHSCANSWRDVYTLTDIILDEAQEPDEED